MNAVPAETAITGLWGTRQTSGRIIRDSS